MLVIRKIKMIGDNLYYLITYWSKCIENLWDLWEFMEFYEKCINYPYFV